MLNRHTGHVGKLKAAFIITIFIFSMGFGISSMATTASASSSTDSVNYTAIKDKISQTLSPANDSFWYSTKIDMIIIAPNYYVSTLIPLAEWNDHKGVFTKIINSSEYMSYPGRDTAEKIRNCIKYYYSEYNIEWVLLAGSTDIIPTRYVWNPDVTTINQQGGTPVSEADGQIDYKPTDQYYADLSGNWDTNNNGKFGESLKFASQDEINWTTNVYVGRFPANNVQELSGMVNKTINYEKNPNVGTWMNNILLGASIQDLISSSDSNGELEYYLVQKIIDESITGVMNYTLLTGLYNSTSYNLTQSSFNNYANQGNSITFFAGHGSPLDYAGYEYADGGYMREYFTYSDALSMTNTGMPSLFYADACSTNFFDNGYNNQSSGNCIGTALIENPNGGAIGYIGAMRVSWYYENDSYTLTNGENVSLCELNRGMSKIFFQQMFHDGYYQQGEALYKMKEAYVSSDWLNYNPYNMGKDSQGNEIPYNIHYTEWERKNVLTYNLLGDPEVDIYTNLPSNFSNNIISSSDHFYGGQELKLTVRDSSNHVVPNALLSIQGSNGAYMSFESNSAGQIDIRLPAAAQSYNYTLSAHNMLVYQGSFNTTKDMNPPIFDSNCAFPDGNPSTDHVSIACVNATDLETSVFAGYFVYSRDNFNTYDIVPMYQVNNTNTFEGTIPKMNTGDFSYIIYIFDFSGNANWTTVSINDSFSVKLPLIALFVFGINGIVIISLIAFIYSKKSINRKYSRFLESNGISPPLEQNKESPPDRKI